ncbi:MAG: hypothetical protein LQ343_003445 [Gyalolechia ehrenbergii]|nr:MAG: hypothetical protein LQ343_003445 [Gyalolechia ehrenbergii]
MEAIAIIGCIAAVVSAYRDGGAIVNKIKQKRMARQAPPPMRLLEDSLARGPKAVEEAKENGIERFGPRYAAGDQIAVGELKDILIDLQGSLLRHLRQAQEDDNMTDFTTLVDASDFGRIRTVNVLNELYMRVATSATIAPNVFGDMGTLTNPQIRAEDGRITPKLLSQVPTDIASGPGNSNPVQTTFREQASPEHQGLHGKQVTPHISPRLGFFDRFRRKSSTEGGSSGKSNSRSPRIQSNYEVTFQENRRQHTLLPPPMTSPSASIIEDNPWVTESSGQHPTVSESTPDRSVSRATTLVASIRQPSSTVSNTSPTSNVRMQSPYEMHGGFCKGAYKMQVREQDAMKLRSRSTAESGEGCYWACCSSKCAFEGPARQIGRNWTFDDAVRETHGVRYRWSFLAKAHLRLAKVKNGIYDYGCVFCIYDGFGCPVYHGIRDFLEHVGAHRGKSIAETVLQRLKCINDKVADPADDFDVNLTPLEAEFQHVSEDKNNPLNQPGMMSAAVTERNSWTTNVETMIELDPWKGVT